MDRLLEETRRRLRESEALFRVSQAFTSVLDLDELLQVIIDSAVETIDPMERGAIHILDEASGELQPKALSGKALGALRERKMRIGEGVAGYALEQGRAVNVPDINTEPRFVRDSDDPGLKSLLVVPLILGQKRIGTLSVDSERVGAFDEDDERLLMTLATQATIAIENARLYEEVRKELAERKRVEEALRKRTHDLGERVKDLSCLYGISSLLEKPGILLEDILQGAVDLLPLAWQYPDITCARITVEGQEYATENFRETEWKQVAGIIVHGHRAGAVEVGYLEQRPQSDEGPFVKEERALINAVAEQLARITERERMEEALRESEEQYRNLFERVPVGLYRTTLEGEILDVNPALVRMLGYPDRETLMAANVSDGYVNAEDRARWQTLIEQEGVVSSFEVQWWRHDGPTIWVREGARAIQDADGQVVYYEGAVEDITARKQTEEALRRAHDELEIKVQQRTAELVQINEALRAEIAQRRQAEEAELLMTQFISNVSHELRTPLSVISLVSGNLDTLYERLDDDKRQQMVRDIREHARILNDLIGSVLELSRIDSGRVSMERQRLDLAQLAREEADKQQPLAQKNSQSLRVTGVEHLAVWGNDDQLRRVIRNLLNNAIKYTPDGGQITCECLAWADGVAAETTWPGNDGLPAGRWAALRVVDNGPGISQEDLAHLFERFSRVESQRSIPGTGLGLSIAQELIKLHEGHIAVSSTPGEGSVFAVYLPLLEE